MTYVITDLCTKDGACVDVCPVDCIHPRTDEAAFETEKKLYIDPEVCIDCGACVPVCPVDAIFQQDELPAEHAHATEVDAEWYRTRGAPGATTDTDASPGDKDPSSTPPARQGT